MGRLSREQASRLSKQNREYMVSTRDPHKEELRYTVSSAQRNSQFKTTLKNQIIKQGIDHQKNSSPPETQDSWDALKEKMLERVDDLHGRKLEEWSRNYEYLIDDVFRYHYDQSGNKDGLNWSDAQEKMLSMASQLGIRYNRYFDSEEQKQKNREQQARYREEQLTFYSEINRDIYNFSDYEGYQ